MVIVLSSVRTCFPSSMVPEWQQSAIIVNLTPSASGCRILRERDGVWAGDGVGGKNKGATNCEQTPEDATDRRRSSSMMTFMSHGQIASSCVRALV